MAERYIRVQIDFAHFRDQLTALLELMGILESNIGTVLKKYYEFDGIRFRTREIKIGLECLLHLAG